MLRNLFLNFVLFQLSGCAHANVAPGQECANFDVKSEKIQLSGYLKFFNYPGGLSVLRLFTSKDDYANKRLDKSVLIQGAGGLYPDRERIERGLVKLEGVVKCLKETDSLAYRVSLTKVKVLAVEGPKPDTLAEVRRSDVEVVENESDNLRKAVDSFLERVALGDVASASSYLGFDYGALPPDSYYRKRLEWVLVRGAYSVRSILNEQVDGELVFVKSSDMKVDAFCRLGKNWSPQKVSENFRRLLMVGGYGGEFCLVIDPAKPAVFVDKVQFGLSFAPRVR